MTNNNVNVNANLNTSPVDADRIAGASESWRRLDDIATVAVFAFSGNATLTLVNNAKSPATRVTVRLTGTKLPEGGRSSTEFAVRALVARNDGQDVYAEIGILSRDEEKGASLDTLRRTTDNRRRRRYVRDRARWSEHRTATRTVEWLLGYLNAGRELPETIEVFNAGRCRCCGKTLRVPSYSNNRDEIVAGVVVGLGPVCANEASSRDSVPVREGASVVASTPEPTVDRAAFAESVDSENPANLELVEVGASRVSHLLDLLEDDSTGEDW